MTKAIICDLDRTLLHTDKTISSRTVSAMQACHDRGILLMAATARPSRTIEAYRKLIPFDAVTALNGAQIILPDKTIFVTIPKDDALSLAGRLSEVRKAFVSLETSAGIFSNRDIPEWQPRVYSDLTQAPLPDEIYKLLVSSEEADIGMILPPILPESLYYTVANETLYQVMSNEATKWKGICRMLSAFDIDPDDAVYFGDDHDDLEPISRCGTGVAVANAIDAVLSAADSVTASNDHDGVALYIEQNIMK